MALVRRVNCSLCIVVAQLTIILLVIGQHALCADGSTRQSNLIVEFSPYVSVLDKHDLHRYNISEQMPLIEKVATEYNRVIIDLKNIIFTGDYHSLKFPSNPPLSIWESPLAIATYNQRLKDSEPKLEVWITSTDRPSEDEPVILSRHLKYIADKANDIYEGTVTTLLLPYRTKYFSEDTLTENVTKEIRNERECNSIVFKRSYKWGIINMDREFYSETSPRQHCNISKFLNADIVVFYRGSQNLDYDASLYCNQHQGNESNTKLAFWFSTSDTDDYGVANMLGFVENWNNLQQFADANNATFIMSKAFDTTCEPSVTCKSDSQTPRTTGQEVWSLERNSGSFTVTCMPMATCKSGQQSVTKMSQGWWSLVENREYSSTAEYFFERKRDIAERFDREANSVNLTLIEKSEANLTRPHIGTIFSLTFSETYRKWEIDSIKKTLVDEISASAIISSYSKMVILFDQNNTKADDRYKTVDVTFRFVHDMEMIVLFLPGVSLEANRYSVLKFSGNPIDYNFLKIPTFVFSVDTQNYAGHISNELEIKKTIYRKPKIGYAFPISYCNFARLTEKEKGDFVKTWNKSSLLLFTFEEDDETVKLGAERMFQQRAVTFAQCERFLRKMKSFSPSIGDVQHGFVMLHYGSPPNMYHDVIALYNFVLYREKLKDWAVRTETMIIMSSALDCTRYLEGGRMLVQEMGWWRHQYTKNSKGRSNIHYWIDKKTELLNHKDLPARIPTTPVVDIISRENVSSSEPPETRQPEPTQDLPVSTKDIVFIAVSIMLIVCIGIIVLFLARKYFTHKFLSTCEVNDFLNGSQNSDNTTSVYKSPYDKSRFEIDPKSFTIDHTKVLGSGEFGMVCPGKVETSVGIFVDVAVKMVNSNKFHKTTLTGLLSEIKVLTHVGKHENVIELVGAYTRELRTGKIFVFLELGQCGSLEKYLRNRRPQPAAENDGVRIEDGIELAEMHDRSDIGDGGRLFLLDEATTKDMYRWSKEICSGMSFLATKHVVHADLATRNVLLNAEKTAKICDFGLSRRMYNYANYVKQRQEPLPWKWLPPETLQLMEFNEKSDVWAYGVTLWEIYSLGETPYPGLSWDPNFAHMLEQGFRMCSPKYNDRNMYSLMMKCWNTNPFGRPSFADLLLLFDEDKIVE